MDPFLVIMVAVVGGLLVALVLLGLFYPGSGAAQIDWRPTRSVEVEVQNEVDDLDQMLEAANERRRRRGADALTEDGLRATVAADLREQTARRDGYLAQKDVEQMLTLKNERRRRRGLPEITEDDFRAQVARDHEGHGA